MENAAMAKLPPILPTAPTAAMVIVVKRRTPAGVIRRVRV